MKKIIQIMLTLPTMVSLNLFAANDVTPQYFKIEMDGNEVCLSDGLNPYAMTEFKGQRDTYKDYKANPKGYAVAWRKFGIFDHQLYALSDIESIISKSNEELVVKLRNGALFTSRRSSVPTYICKPESLRDEECLSAYYVQTKCISGKDGVGPRLVYLMFDQTRNELRPGGEVRIMTKLVSLTKEQYDQEVAISISNGRRLAEAKAAESARLVSEQQARAKQEQQMMMEAHRILRELPVGTTLFCSNSNVQGGRLLLTDGSPINAIPYNCDKVRGANLMLDGLLEAGWEIESERQTPYSGWEKGNIVNLRLKKKR